MQPKFQDESPVNPFELWAGANFKMKISQVAGFRNYDRSEFANAEALNADDSALEAIYNQQHSLSEFTDPTSFKSYSELNLKLTRVLGEDAGTSQEKTAMAESVDDSPFNDEPTISDPVATAADPIARADSDNDDTMSYFAKLAAEA